MARKRESDYRKEKADAPFAVNKAFRGQQAQQLRLVRQKLTQEKGRVPPNNAVLDYLVGLALPIALESKVRA